MNREEWARLKEIVADALEEDSPAARTALLTRACGNDSALLKEAESYLHNAETSIISGEDRLEECAAVAAAAIRPEGSPMIGRRIGAYIIVRELGRGGMATVYLAARADGYFEKEVAIKVLKVEGGSTAEVIARFRAERELLASLDHPNIATIFDAGTTEEGMPYFVMEYVPGTRISTYLREHHLTVRERLGLFLKICTAVEVAHRRRIVHRDLKRNNILVNEEGEPKLLDFGIAKLLQDSPLVQTAPGQRALTPISASPEQARGESVTTQSDIYALGALLYEMLTGKEPHQFPSSQPALEEVERIVCEQDPLLPSAATSDPETQRALRGDLDAIILRAMRKEPSERYPSVHELAEDIRHYLAGEPVVARPNTLSYRLLRFAGRHNPGPLRAGITVLLLLLAVGVGLFFMQRHSKPVTAPPRLSRPAAAIPKKSIAVLPFDDFDAPDGSSYFADGVQDDILTNLAKAEDLKVTSRAGASAYRKGVRDVRAIREDLGVAYVLEGSVRRVADHVRVNVQLIDTQSDTQVWAEQYDRKLDDLFALQSDVTQAIVGQLNGKLSPKEKAAIESRPTNDVRAYDLYLQARASFLSYDYAKAARLLDEAIARDPKFAQAYCLLTDVELYIYRFGGDSSPEHLDKAKVASDTALRLAPNLAESHLAKAQYYYNGLRDYEKAQVELAAAPPSRESRAKFFDLSALTERRLGQWKEALRDGEKAWELDPHDPFIATEVIQTYMSLHRYADAERLADKAIKLIPARVAPFWSFKVECLLAQGQIAKASEVLAAAPPKIYNRHTMSARIAAYSGDFEQTKKDIEAARNDEMAPTDDYLKLLLATLARVQGNAAAAYAGFETARQELESALEQHPDTPPLLSDLSWAYAGLGRKEEALRRSQQAVNLVPIWRDAVEGPFYAAMQAEIQAMVGNKDAAIEQLSTLVRQPGGPSYGELKFDPGWDDLRGDPRFATVLAEAAKPVSVE
jgi:serine/threonine protein kinase/Tfp pilus assembly protein PilF